MEVSLRSRRDPECSLPCKIKRQQLLTFQISSYFLLTLQGSITPVALQHLADILRSEIRENTK